MLSRLNIIFKVTQQVDKLVDPYELKQLTYGLQLYIKDVFPFVMITPTVHQLLSH